MYWEKAAKESEYAQLVCRGLCQTGLLDGDENGGYFLLSKFRGWQQISWSVPLKHPKAQQTPSSNVRSSLDLRTKHLPVYRCSTQLCNLG